MELFRLLGTIAIDNTEANSAINETTENANNATNHSSALGEVQGSLADALEWSGITVDDFNAQLAECSTEEERQDLIMRTLKDTYSEAADQYKETNKDVLEAEKANERLADAMADIGTE